MGDSQEAEDAADDMDTFRAGMRDRGRVVNALAICCWYWIGSVAGWPVESDLVIGLVGASSNGTSRDRFLDFVMMGPVSVGAIGNWRLVVRFMLTDVVTARFLGVFELCGWGLGALSR